MIIIGISGASGSGKSLLANNIIEKFDISKITIISEDNYYKDQSDLTMEERGLINYDHPDTFDHELLCQHLLKLKSGDSIQSPIYDHSTHSRLKQTKTLKTTPIIILEGILLFSDKKIREQIDIKVFVDTPIDICLIRRIERDISIRNRTIESISLQYLNTVRPMFLKFIEPSKKWADLIVPHGGENFIALEVLNAKIRELIR